MSGLWHIVRKDARRIRLPVTIWLASIFVVAAWMRFAPTSSDHWPFTDLTMWLEIAGVATAVAAWAQIALGAVLAGVIMQEDPAAGTTMFWRTRPISAGRLLAAKLAGVAGLIVVAPVVVLAPIWALSGFSAGEMLEAAWDWVKWMTLAGWLAIVASAVSGNLRQFMFAWTGLAAVVGFTRLRYLPFFTLADRAPSLVRESREVAVVLLCLVGGALVLAKAYRARDGRDARVALVLTVTLLLIVRLWWPWTIWGAGLPAPLNNLSGTVSVTVLPARPAKAGAEIPLRIDGSGAAIEVMFANGNLTLADGSRRSIRNGGHELALATVKDAALGNRIGAAESALPVSLLEAEMRAWRAQPAAFEGSAGLVVMRPQVLGECALAEGAEIVSGAAALRVLEVFSFGERTGARQLGVMIEERDAWRAWRDGSFLNDIHSPGRRRNTAQDAYVVVPADGQNIARLNVSSGITIVRHGILRSVVLLETVPGFDWRNARLVKLRFEKTNHVLRSLRAERLPLEP